MRIIPTAIDGTNASASVRSASRLAIAGPGQRPPSPHPIPKRTAPIIRGFETGLPLSRGSERGDCNNRQHGVVTIKAPPMTKASVGSQSQKMSRKAVTLRGSVMPEIANSAPNKAPPRNISKLLFIRR